jgi:hypothetical protein
MKIEKNKEKEVLVAEVPSAEPAATQEAEFPWPPQEFHESAVEIQNLVETARGVALILNTVDYISWEKDLQSVLFGLSAVLKATADAVDVEVFKSLGSTVEPNPGIKNWKIAHLLEKELQDVRLRVHKAAE